MSTNHPIWQTVQELMHHNNCVIIPGFGGFVLNEERSKIDQITHVITPPGKHVVFNPNLKTNDGLLAANFSQQKGISYQTALDEINQLVEDVYNQLKKDKQLIIESFGKFRLNAEANVVFLPNTTNRYDFDSFGLYQIQASAVASRQIAGKHTRTFKDLNKVKFARKVKRNKFWPTTLAITLIGLLAINSWIFFTQPDKDFIEHTTANISSWISGIFKQDSNEQIAEAPINQNEILPAIVEQEIIEEDENTEEPYAEQLTVIEETVAEVHIETTPINYQEVFVKTLSGLAAAYTRNELPPTPIVEEVVEVAVPISTAVVKSENVLSKQTTTIDQVGSYHVIVGVFFKDGNAEKFVRELSEKGINASIIPSSNGNKVSVASFNKKSDAESYLNQAKSIHPEAWVMTSK
jgi:nucleoid DNA-binding protein/cell division protein FtsN